MSENSRNSDIITIKLPTFGFGKFLNACRESPWMVSSVALIIMIILILVFSNVSFLDRDDSNGGEAPVLNGITFSMSGDDICTDSSGKPYVILFSTTSCPHCQWIKDTFDSLANEDFANEINLQHWELDTNDNTLTSNVETSVPSNIGSLFSKYGGGYVPTFVFGCSYTRVGNGYESQNDLDAEKAEFKRIIEEGLLG